MSIDTDTTQVTEDPGATIHPPVSTAAKPCTAALLQQQLSLIFRDLKEQAGMQRIMLAMLRADQKSVRARFIVGAAQGSPLSTFQHPLGERHLLTLLINPPPRGSGFTAEPGTNCFL